jgi:hypothetical protein
MKIILLKNDNKTDNKTTRTVERNLFTKPLQLIEKQQTKNSVVNKLNSSCRYEFV